MRDELKREEQTATDLRGRDWKDRYEGCGPQEKKALRRKARRKLNEAARRSPPGGKGAGRP